MASVTIRKIEENVKTKLRIRAAKHGHSLEQELRQILTQAAHENVGAVMDRKVDRAPDNAADAIMRIVDPIGGIEFDPPPRTHNRAPPRFDE